MDTAYVREPPSHSSLIFVLDLFFRWFFYGLNHSHHHLGEYFYFFQASNSRKSKNVRKSTIHWLFGDGFFENFVVQHQPFQNSCFQLVCQILSVTPKGWAEEQAETWRLCSGDGPFVTMNMTIPRHPNTSWEGKKDPRSIRKTPSEEVLGCLGNGKSLFLTGDTYSNGCFLSGMRD